MKHLTKEQRYQIAAYLNCGKSKKSIAEALGVDKTTVYREINRNSKIGYCKSHNIPMVSHQRIYAYIREDKRQRGNLYTHLRHQLKHRKRPVSGKQNAIKDRVSIDLRSDTINNKLRFGDWEIDLIIGKDRKGAIVTIVERTTAFFLIRKLPFGKNAKELAKIVINTLLPYKDFIHSITSDNGKEFAAHKKITEKLVLQFFFAHPY